MTSKKQTKKSSISVGKVVAIGAGVAALGAGAYYFLGPNGKKNQKKAAVWMVKMRKEVEKKMITIKNISEPIYKSAVDALANTYSKQYKEYSGEIKSFAKQLKSEWTNVKSKTKPAVKQAKKSVKKTIKAVKKIATKKRK